MTISRLIVTSVIILGMFSCSENQTQELTKRETAIKGRAEFELNRLKDPITGKIPENIRMRELAFASTLPKSTSGTARDSKQIYAPVGPRNVGGRTRAITFHTEKPDLVLAGGVSGGVWRSTDLGQSWNRTTSYEDHSAVSCIIQDKRPGKSNVFYYGSGESIGNSASKSFSAYYYGSGMYKSIDDGATWTHITSTQALVHKRTVWSYIYNIAIDNSNTTQDVLFAATSKGIQRSEDGGQTWTLVLGGASNADYTNIEVSATGICYATISNNGAQPGFWRSVDGINWVDISPADLSITHQRTLMAISPSNENSVYYYTVTPNVGLSNVSFWKYEYLNGDGSGSGGSWSNRSNNLPPVNGYNLNTQSNYCMSLIVKPDNENIVFLGATNLFISKSGFASSGHTRQLGGYDADGYPNFDMYRDNQHPDQQSLAFRPQDANHLLAGTDGGLHFTTDPNSSKVIWQSFNNGYQTTQFYGLAIDHIAESEVVCSGYQDNGSWWTNSADTITNWKYVMGGDGSYCAKEGAKDNYYFSSQYGAIRRVKLNSNGFVLSRKSATPRGLSGGYLFSHPFILNPSNENQMYLPNRGDLWRNSDLSSIDNNQYRWNNIASVSGSITALSASENVTGIVYVGTSGGRIYKIKDNGGIVAQVENVTDGITSGRYASSIAIHPNDTNKVLAVFSNYNVISMWYSENAGATWSNVEGNLVGDSDPGVPPNLSYLGNGPSFRCAKFIETAQGDVILLGTSIGLFATNTLDGENTEWVQQASDVIGNVVIEQIDYRKSDGFCVIATHGMGAYKTYFDNNWDITSIDKVVNNEMNIQLFPNPTTDQAQIRYHLKTDQVIEISILGTNGTMLETKRINALKGNNQTTLETSTYANGVYYITIRNNQGSFTKSLMKQ